MKDKIRFTVLVVLCIFLAGCESSATPTFELLAGNLKDQSFLTDTPCEAPCWYDLIPDKSTKQEVLDILPSLTFIDPASVETKESTWWGDTPQATIPSLTITANCAQPTTSKCVEVLLIDDKVKHIYLFPNYRLTFEEIVNHFGNPAYVNTHPWGVECAGCVIALQWLNPSIIISNTDTRCNTGLRICERVATSGRVPRDLQVDLLAYLGAVPSYQQPPRMDVDVLWLGFEEP